MPIVNVTTNQRKALSLSVTKVGGHVHQALSEPDTTYGCLYSLSVDPEMDHTGAGNKELTQRSAQNVQGLAKKSQKDMAGFMEEEIGSIDEVVAIRKDEPQRVWNAGNTQETLKKHMLSILRESGGSWKSEGLGLYVGQRHDILLNVIPNPSPLQDLSVRCL